MIYVQSHKDQITAPFARLGLGIFLIFLAIVVLWLNEGAMDVAKITKASIALPADKVEKTANRKLVSITGKLTTLDEIGDPQFLKPGLYIKIVRKVQMFAWQEVKKTKGYQKGWTAEPKPVNGNPALTIRSKAWLAPSAMIGVYAIDPLMIELPPPAALKLSPDKVSLGKGERLEGNYYIYLGGGTFKKPRIGDLRVSFAAIENSWEVTAFGKKQIDMLAPFVTIEYKFYKVFKGTRDQAFGQLPAQHTFRLWAMRLVGLLIMWLGLSLFSLPIEMLARRKITLARPLLIFFVAAVASVLVMLLSIYSINVLILLFLALAGYFAYAYIKNRK
jgi:hypothetical protein